MDRLDNNRLSSALAEYVCRGCGVLIDKKDLYGQPNASELNRLEFVQLHNWILRHSLIQVGGFFVTSPEEEGRITTITDSHIALTKEDL